MDIFDAMIDRRQSIMETLALMDPHDLEALVQGTNALRIALEMEAVDSAGHTFSGAETH